MVEYHDLPPARGRKDRYVVVNRRSSGAILCIEHGTSATTGWDAVPEGVLILPSPLDFSNPCPTYESDGRGTIQTQV